MATTPSTTKPRITAWSYSRLTLYESCPFKAKCKFIDKLPEKENPAMFRGGAIHSLAEEYVSGHMSGKPADKLKAEDLRPEFEKVILPSFKKDFTTAKKGKPLCEQEWAFTSSWEPTGWFDKDAWCRIKTDLIFWRKKELVITDHKTGKKRESHKDQLSLYAVGGFLLYPVIERISSELWYLDQGPPNTAQVFLRENLTSEIKRWEDRARPMLADTTFVATPSRECTWCPYSKSNGGPCKF